MYSNKEAGLKSGEQISFSFGLNWRKFIDNLSENQLKAAEEDFIDFTGFTRLDGHVFLDAGCGSGLSSLVAIQMGANKVISIDIDPHSIESTMALKERYGKNDPSWEMYQCSLLDEHALRAFPPSTFVYAWGSVHHTGEMWKAVDNLINCVTPGGLLLLAIYNEGKYAGQWLIIKRMYNKSPWFLKKILLLSYHFYAFLRMLLKFENPVRYVREYRQPRGMNYFRNVEDWLGGLPYEYASVETVTGYVCDKGFDLVGLRRSVSHGCNEFLFKKKLSSFTVT